MAGKLYTVAEANALLPHLAPALVELREKFEAAAQIRADIAETAQGNGGSTIPDEWSETLARVSELFGRLQKWEVQLRDVTSGLVDLPAEIDGQQAWLCWRLGEAEVAHWHPRDEGFAGRRPLY